MFKKKELVKFILVIGITSVISIAITNELSKKNIENINDRITDIEYRQDKLDYINESLKAIIYGAKYEK